MKNTSIRSLFAVVALGITFTVTAHAKKAGAVDFGSFVPAAGKEYVEVNIKPGLIKFAAKIVAIDDPEAAKLLRSVEGIRVHVMGLDNTNRGATTERMNNIRASLSDAGWEKIVAVMEADDEEGDDVAIFVKTEPEDTIAGIVVTVLSKDGEAVFVNVVGNIKAEEVATIANKLDIKPLRDLKVKEGEPDEAV